MVASLGDRHCLVARAARIGRDCQQEIRMPLKRYRARVRLATMTSEVTVEAENFFAAKQQLEATYGVGSITWGPVEA